PAASPQATSPRGTPDCALPARKASMRGRQPASRAVTSTAAPSAANRPVSRRALRISSERMSFTRSFCRLVIARTPAVLVSGRGIARRPARVKGGGQEPPRRLLGDGELAALGCAGALGEALAHQGVGGERRGADGVGGEHEG